MRFYRTVSPVPAARRPEVDPWGFHLAGGLLSVALSLGSPPPAVSRPRVSVEPGLSSPRGTPEGAAKGGHPAVWQGAP